MPTKRKVKQQAAPQAELVKIEKLMPSPFQRRKKFDQEKLEELAVSVGKHGVILPLVARRVESPAVKEGETYEELQLVAGERRMRAAKIAGLQEVPVIFRELSDREAAEICVLENLQREDLTLLEEARSLQALEELGMKIEEIAKELGVKKNYVYRRIRILQLPPEALDQVERGTLSLITAEKLMVVEEEKRGQALEELTNGGLESGELTQRRALEVLDRGFIAPAKIEKAWADAREEVMGLLPEYEWEDYDAASGLLDWRKPYRPVEDPVHTFQLEPEHRQDPPTWGQLAARFGAKGKIAAEYIEGLEDLDQEQRGTMEGFLVGDFQVRPVVDIEAISAAEMAEAEAEGRASMFTQANHRRELTEEEKLRKAEEATEERKKQAARSEERRGLCAEILGGDLSRKKEQALALELIDSEAAEYGVLSEVVDWLGELEQAENDEDADQRRERVMKHLRALIRRPNGAAAVLGRLLLVEAVAFPGAVGSGVIRAARASGMLKKFPQLEADAQELEDQEKQPEGGEG